MTPRGLLQISSLLMTSLFLGLLAVQGRSLDSSQLHGVVFAALMSLALNVLLFKARTLSAAARWYIAVLAVAVVGSVAAAVVRQNVGDVVGLLGSLTAALICAAQCVTKLRAPGVDDAVISPRAIDALQRLTSRISYDVSDTLVALARATPKSEPFLLERLGQLRVEVAHADAWSRRMRLPEHHPARADVSAVKRRLFL